MEGGTLSQGESHSEWMKSFYGLILVFGDGFGGCGGFGREKRSVAGMARPLGALSHSLCPLSLSHISFSFFLNLFSNSILQIFPFHTYPFCYRVVLVFCKSPF